MGVEDLTDREEEIAELLVKGHSTSEIAQRLWIAVATVRNHIQKIMEKLDVHSRVAAIAAFRQRKTDPVGRVLTYCRRAGIRLTPLQSALIRSAFAAEQVGCERDRHVFPPRAPGKPNACLCGAMRVTGE